MESSTDELRRALPLDEITQSSTSQLSKLHDSSEVGPCLLWTHGGSSCRHDDSLPGPSSHGASSYRPARATEPSRGSLMSVFCPQESGRVRGPGLLVGQVQGRFNGADTEQETARRRVCVCQFCGKGFRSQANLDSHVRTHTGEKPFTCSVCGRKFSQFWNLKIHHNIHTGERPYACSICPDRFSDPSNLKKHQRRHHSHL